MQAAIELLRRELRALSNTLKDNAEESASLLNGHRAELSNDISAIHREADEIQEALDVLIQAQQGETP